MTTVEPLDLTGRGSYVGASEVASLFGVGFRSRWRLWQEKAGNLDREDISDEERVYWGSVLEPQIALGVAERTGWKLRDVKRLIRHPAEHGLACHPDREVVAHPRGPGLVEIKTVGRNYWWTKWREDGPPLGYQLQLQTQLACMGREWGAIAALVGGQKLEVYEIDAHSGAQSRILREVAEFWRSIEAGEEPEIDFQADGNVLGELYGIDPAKVVELPAEADALVAIYELAKNAEKAAGRAKDEARARILRIVKDAELATTPAGARIKRTHVAEKQVSFLRKASYRTTITPPRGEENDL